MCDIYIERNQGCAQMLCKSCKHTFCWYCLQNLDVSLAPARYASSQHFGRTVCKYCNRDAILWGFFLVCYNYVFMIKIIITQSYQSIGK